MVQRQWRVWPEGAYSDGPFRVCALQDAHIEPIRIWRNAQRRVLRQAHEITPEMQAAYFSAEVWPHCGSATPSQVLMAFEERGEFVAYGGIVHIDWAARRGEVSFLCRTEVAGTAEDHARLFPAFLDLLKTVAFSQIGLRRLWAETYDTRTGYPDALRGAGFRDEGRLRAHYLIEGRLADSVIQGFNND